MDIIITGASRGIGRALALALPPANRVHAVARDREALDSLAKERANTTTYVHDVTEGPLDFELRGPTTLVHNAGLWPAKRERVNGVERAWAVNVLGPLAFQRPLLPKLDRILVVGAGLMVKGRFDAHKTPAGEDFSGWYRTYASTKLAFAVAMRDIAKANPHIDVAVMHPGIVRTDLGLRGGVLGWLVKLVKRNFEAPETCASRLASFLERERWSPPGDARWFFSHEGGVDEQPWPKIVDESAEAVREALRSAPAFLAPEKHVEARA